MRKTVLLILLTLLSTTSFGQIDKPAFMTLMEMAKIKKVIAIETSAGNTNVLYTSITENPDYVFVFQPGGDGTVTIEARPDGAPYTKRVRNPAYYFAPEFLKRQAGWALVDVPESFGETVSRDQRREDKHIHAMTQVGRKLREEFPNAKLILIGHSNGGITAALQSSIDKPVYHGFVFSAPNTHDFPIRWSPSHAKAPIKFITHANDDCGHQYKRPSIATLTISMAGNRHPLTVIKAPSPGNRIECFAAPAPHFFTDTYEEYTDAILKWVASLK